MFCSKVLWFIYICTPVQYPLYFVSERFTFQSLQKTADFKKTEINLDLIKKINVIQRFSS